MRWGQRIKFTSNQATPTKGDWNRIAINNGTSVLNYLQVEYADSGIYVGPQIPPGLTIQNSVFQNNRKGIYIDWGSTVVIDGNTITNNDDGIYVLCQFSGCAPRINHNSIYSNANYNLLMSTPGWSFSGITIDAENNWWGTTDPNVIMGTIWDFLDDGYSPRVDFDPFLNSLGGSPLVTGGSVTPQFFGPYDNQLATISYSLTQNANVTIKIFSYPNHVLLRTLINAVPKLAGINQDAWDGKNDNLQVLPEAVYYFEISAITSQNETGGYSPPYNSGSVQIINGSLTPANFNPAKGDLATIRYDLVAPSWVTLRVGWSRVPTPSPHRILIDNQPRDITNNTELWDGRQDNGSLVTGDWYLVAGWTQIMPENVIVIQNRSASRVTSVTSNPYVMYPQYGEMTEIKYQITRDARVTVLIKEQGGNAVRTLVNNEQKIAGQHSVIWNGKDNYGNVVSSPGHYRIEVSITDLQMPITRTLTGNITVF